MWAGPGEWTTLGYSGNHEMPVLPDVRNYKYGQVAGPLGAKESSGFYSLSLLAVESCSQTKNEGNSENKTGKDEGRVPVCLLPRSTTAGLWAQCCIVGKHCWASSSHSTEEKTGVQGKCVA